MRQRNNARYTQLQLFPKFLYINSGVLTKIAQEC